MKTDGFLDGNIERPPFFREETQGKTCSYISRRKRRTPRMESETTILHPLGKLNLHPCLDEYKDSRR
jgi:hypothetical protein